MVNSGYIFCLAYLFGLLLNGFPHGWLYSLGLGTIATAVLPRFWRCAPQRSTLAIATLTAIAAGAYLQLRTPSPTLYNVSHWVSSDAEVSCVTGTLQDSPQMTRRGQLKVPLSAAQIEVSAPERTNNPADAAVELETSQPESSHSLSDPVDVEGRLYVTLPLLQGTGLYPTQSVRACGQLYAPRPAKNPGGFDFAAYLGRQGVFAGLQATSVAPMEISTPPLLWQLRQRIVRAFVHPLGSPKGVLLSAMVLGRKAVDLPYDIRDPFSQAGLAHTLAASGFHVSLLLGLFLLVTQRLSPSMRLGLGIVVLLGYTGLTGLQPSICRAVFMGMAALLSSTLERKTRPVGLLLLAALIILLINPIWIWNLGFQLSFLATLGLLVTTQPLTQRLDWLPTPIATALAVPMAAIAWTLPLQLWAFNTLSPYSLPLNVVITPLVSLVSLVGMVDAAIALVAPSLASAVAQLLSWPIDLLMGSVTLVNQLPGQTIALSQSLLQVGAIYGGFILICWARPRQRLILGVALAGLVLIPGWWTQQRLVQVTVLAGRSPMVVVQDRGVVGVIGDSGAPDLSYGLLPFLRRQGVNRLDWAIDIGAVDVGARDERHDWRDGLAVQQSYRLGEQTDLGSTQTFGDATVQRVGVPAMGLDVAIAGQHWLVLGRPIAGGESVEMGIQSAVEENNLKEDKFEADRVLPTSSQHKPILVWSGRASLPDGLPPLKAAIASSDAVAPAIEAWVTAQNISVHVAGRDGALQWRPGLEVGQLSETNAEF